MQIYDLGKIGESYFIAMEYVFGRDMRRIIPKADTMGIPFPMVYALKIASSRLRGPLLRAPEGRTSTATRCNIVHRDVTPENIFVSFDGTVKVLDFGIAKAREPDRADARRGDQGQAQLHVARSSAWASRSTAAATSSRSGVVLYEWLTGFKLFTGDSEVAILKQHHRGEDLRARATSRPTSPRRSRRS